MPSFSTILGILLAVAVAWGSAATWYALDLVEQKAVVESALLTANANTVEQKQINSELRAAVAAEQRAVEVLGEERRKDDVRHQKDLARIAGQRSTAEAAARNYPERYGAIATFRLRRSMRDVCRSGGGNKDDCFIKPVSPAKTSTNIAAEPESEPSASVETD